MNDLPLFNEWNTTHSSNWSEYASIKHLPYVINSHMAIKTALIKHPNDIPPKMKDTPHSLLISTETKEKKDESAL